MAVFLKDVKRYIWVMIAFLIYNAVVMTVIGAFCPVEIMTGFPCPGCGMTRALLCVLTGQIAESARYNICVYLWIPIGLWFIWNRYIKGRKAKGIFVMMGAAGCVMLLWHGYRMAVHFPGEEPLVFFEDNMIGRIFPVYNEKIHQWMSR